MNKRPFTWLSLGALALLDLAALDDITTGVQPDFSTEWLMLILSVPLAYLLIERLRSARSVRRVALPDGEDAAIAELQQAYLTEKIDTEEYERRLDELLIRRKL